MANLIGRFVDYRKVGPGVRKNSKKVYSMSEFWRIYRDKFFKLLGLNVMYVLCLVLVGLICYIPMSKFLDTDNYMCSKLEGYELNSQYVSLITAYTQSYKIDDATVDKAVPYFADALERIKNVNNELLVDGTGGFDLASYSADDKEYIFDKLKSGFRELNFSLQNGDEKNTYLLKDVSGRVLASVKLSTAGFDFTDSLPRSVFDLAKFILCLAPTILLGPINLAFFRVTRDYVRESPSFMFPDIWDALKNNWWQGFVIGILQYAGFSCVSVSLIWYLSYYNNGFFFQVGFALCVVLAYILVSMSFYMGIMQVSLDMNLRKIIKNAFFLSVICLWRNLFMILITAILAVIMFVLVVFGMAYPQVLMPMAMILILIALFSFWYYFISFMTYPSLLKYIVDPYYEKLKAEKAEEEVDNDNGEDEAAAPEESEYVYHNGRMVHRSILEQESLFTDEKFE